MINTYTRGKKAMSKYQKKNQESTIENTKKLQSQQKKKFLKLK